MPQRAVIYEETGQRDVHAYDLSDEHWYGVIEAAEANRLILPCCGVTAKPRDPETKIRHFAHPPYTLDKCQAKKTGAGHEAIVASVAATAMALGWHVTTEAKYEAGFCDIVCERPQSGLRIGFEFETGTRSSTEIETLDRSLLHNAVHKLYWFFKKGRHGGLPRVQYSNQFSAADQRKAVNDITATCKQIMQDIEDIIHNANEVIQALKESNVPFELSFVDQIPDYLFAYPDSRELPYRIKFKPNKVEVEHPEIRVAPDNMVKGERIARAQESLIQIIRRNLKGGKSVWWKGHPRLLKDSFQELREALEREERQKQFLAQHAQKK